ncbi:MAG: exodeoxyribonuclease VII large subunit [Campylobacterota bacterium]|nr:exodeoxyribonuclease VII large subunit [Campylobacterota bacterium]
MHTLTVSSLNEQIQSLLESSFTRVLVEGELSRITFHNSGHIYFTLKDASSAISGVMFRGNASKLKFRLQEGMKVMLDGAISVYKPRGSYQINCFSIEPAGQGALALAYEQLKEKLASKGYFDESRKKQFPKFPKKIALITSATGAALQDMLRVANSRYRNIEIDIYDVLVQGDSASISIARAIKKADVKNYDFMVVGRGGGSIEDLWAFNEEIVADAIYEATTPIVSAVGHEIDFCLSDFVADMRAATPSAGMQMTLPDTNELYQYLDGISSSMTQSISQILHNKNVELKHLKNSLSQNSVEKKIALKKDEVQKLKTTFEQTISFKIQGFSRELELTKSRFPQVIDAILNNSNNKLLNMKRMLESNNPKFKTKKGFAQISQNKKVIDIDFLNKNDNFELMSDKVVVSAKVIKKEVI